MPQRMAEKPAAGVFFDSDFATIDCALAMGVLHGLQGKNDCRVAVVTVSRPNLAVAAFADSVERYYRGPAGNFAQVPPIGMATFGDPGETSPAFVQPFRKKKPDGTPVYRNEVKSVIDTADPNTMIRNYLDAQYPQNAFFVLAGPATNLAAVLEFPGVPQKIREKVRFLVVAGGAFPAGAPEAHIRADIPAARKVFAEWPTPIVAVGSEVAAAIEFPGASIDREFATVTPDNPIADAYRAHRPMPYDTPSGAMAAALYAARPNEGYFKISAPGTIAVGDNGGTSFTASESGRHRYLVCDPEQKSRIVQAYVELASAKPVIRRFRPVDADAQVDKPATPAKN